MHNVLFMWRLVLREILITSWKKTKNWEYINPYIFLACDPGGFDPGRFELWMKNGLAYLANFSDPGGG